MSPTSSSPREAVVARHAAAFKVHRDSHSIHKAASPPLSSGSGSTNSSVSSSSNALLTSGGSAHHRPPATAPPPPPPRRQQQQQRQPVIIYTDSPRVICTNRRDFMSVVQRLTGLDSHGGGHGAPACINSGSAVVSAAAPQDESSSSSSESCANNTHAAGLPPPYYADAQLMPPPPPALPPLDAHCFMPPDMPLLYAPDADLQQLCAPRGLYGQFAPVVDAAGAIGPGPVMSTNMNSAASDGGTVFSPSMAETVRTFTGYNYH